jgi:hypothetical protein
MTKQRCSAYWMVRAMHQQKPGEASLERTSHYSAKVSLCLIVGGVEIALSSVGGEVCTAQRPLLAELPPSDAILVIDVDGDVARYFVRVENVVRAGSRNISIAAHSYIPIDHAAFACQ